MEALVFDSNSKHLEYKTNYDIPKLRTDRDVLIQVAFSGVCGTDLHIIQGEHPVVGKPFVLGHEFSGLMHEAGPGTRFKKGQRVVVDPNGPCNLCYSCRGGNYNYCSAKGVNTCVGTFTDGGWSQYVVIPDTNVFELPDGVSLEQGALCEPYSCVSHGFDRAAPIAVGQKILVVGAGIIGNLWLTTLHFHGHRDVTVSEMNETRLNIVKNLVQPLGFGDVCDETGYRLITPDLLAQEKTLYDVIVDCTGVGKVMEINFNYSNPGGKYVIFGCCPPDHVASLNPFDIFNKALTVIGVKVNPFSFPKALHWLKNMGDRYLGYKKLGVQVYELSEYKHAIADLKSGTISKAMFKIM